MLNEAGVALAGAAQKADGPGAGLMRSPSLFESVFNNSPTGNYLLSPTPEATILAVNEAFLRASSRRREDLVGRSLWVAFPANPDDPTDTGETVLRNSLARVMASGEADALPAQRYPIRVLASDGRERYEDRYWSAVNTPIFDASGRLVCISHTTIDVTKQVQAEAALRKSEAQYRNLFNSLSEGFCVIEVLFDEDGRAADFRFCETNPAFRQQSGLYDVTGKTMLELAPAHEMGWFEWYGRVVRTGEPVRFQREAKAVGRCFDVYAFRTDALETHQVAVLFRDITEQQATEKRLREQSESLQLALRVGRSGTFEWDARTHRHRWSDEMLLLYGLAPREFAGTDADWLARLVPEDRAAAWAAVERSLATGDFSAEFRIRRGDDGEMRWISGRGQIFFDAGGAPLRMLGINVDVTEQRQLMAELDASKARLEAILNSLTEGVVIFDLDGQVLSVNPAAQELMDYATPGEARLRLPEFAATFEVFSLDDRLLPLEDWPIGRVIRGESFTDYELRVRRKDLGSEKVLSHNGSPVRASDGRAILGVLTMMDVTDRKRAERALQESEQRLALALKASRTAVWEMDVATRELRATDDFLFTMLGYAPGDLTTSPDWLSLIHEADSDGIPQIIEDVIEGRRESYWVELRLRAKDGSWRWILSQAVAGKRDAQGKALSLVGTHTDIDARKQAEHRARDASLHDPLTGLPTRALIMEYGGHLLAAAQRKHGGGALLFIDLDRFKPINDQYGHEVGDRVLQEVAKRLVACTRHEDLVGRLGGDEFVIILPHFDPGRHHAATVSRHVIDHLDEPIHIDKLELSVGASVGIAYYLDHGADMSKLIHAADLAMYQAKQAGRGNYQFYSPELERSAQLSQSIEARLADALKHGKLALHYQPVMDVKSGRLIGAEALVRIADDGGEDSGPASFIPIAEATGLIGELGEWVATEACRQHEAWLREGLEVAISINVSPMQFRQQAFADRLGGIIADSGIDPSCLQLELSESAVMESLDDVVGMLNRIRSLGVKVALDDVGTGYSSLSRLSRLPLDKLKVDQSFVRKIGSDAASRAVTEAIIGLGHSLKLEVIGEGIETEDVLRYLSEHGCNQAQGYWFSRPLPAGEFSQWCRQQLH